jgi:hypothetical protein
VSASLRRRRGRAQLLDRPAELGSAGIVRHLLAVQAQDLRSAQLALRARGSGLARSDLEAALGDAEIVTAWLCRGTLHLVGREDYPWLLGLTAHRRLANSRRRLGQEGVGPRDAERALRIIESALAEDGPLIRPELAARIAAEGIRAEGQAAPHLLALAALQGRVVLGPMRGEAQAFALTRDWLRADPPTQLTGEARRSALAELARRYLRGHAPASAADLSRWAGLPLGDARAGLRAVGDELEELGDGLVDLAGRLPGPGRLPPRLLPPFDPYLLGWRERAVVVPAEHERRIYPGGGILRAAAVVDGLAVGTWSARREAGQLRLAVQPFEALGPGVSRKLEAEAADVARFEALSFARFDVN